MFAIKLARMYGSKISYANLKLFFNISLTFYYFYNLILF
ncbi:hypothetical protein AsAng_0001890 [Aureispira anguillae]|uniref:Uncharacterized protein n=1 Tax=Aureispira anguillae TaxID=2864201 RepID=A0A915Y9H9_9BACT|nr:hypothetical protein AsAng_0001890 [Aureispira anguillae]